MEVRYFWLLDKESQRIFAFYYQPGQESLGDCPTKHHTGAMHLHVRPYYLHYPSSPTHLPRAAKPSTWQGCAKLLGDAYQRRRPLPSIKTRGPNPLAKTTVPTTMESQLANGSYLWIPSVIPSSPDDNVSSNFPSYVPSRPAGIPAESLSASHIIPTRLRNPIHRWSLCTT